MMFSTLFDSFQRFQQHPEQQEWVNLVLDPFDLRFQVDLGIFAPQERLQLGDRGPLDGLAGN
jgi:hypothetical protein